MESRFPKTCQNNVEVTKGKGGRSKMKYLGVVKKNM